jgi:hypothetical protein
VNALRFKTPNVVITALALLIAVHVSAIAESKNTLNDYWFSKRVVLVKTTALDAKALSSLLHEYSFELSDRRLVVFSIINEEVEGLFTPKNETLELSETQLKSLDAQNSVFLIGLDGSLKSSYQSLELDKIFADIDRMPMRRSELRKREKG